MDDILINDLARLKGLSAVGDYIVVRQDGKIMLHNIPSPQPFAALIQLVGKNCDALPLPAHFPRFRHFLLSRESGENLLIFPLGNYYLGFIQPPHITSRQAASEVLDFMKGLLHQEK